MRFKSALLFTVFFFSTTSARADFDWLDFFNLRPEKWPKVDWSIETEIYNDSSPIEGTFSVMGGALQPSNVSLSNPTSGQSFSSVYGAKALYVDFAYERHLFHLLGPVSLRGGLSVVKDSGPGFLLSSSQVVYLESFDFWAFPLSLGASYELFASPDQFIYPFANASVMYVPFFELRADNEKFHGGGNFHMQFGAGVRINLDWIHGKSAWTLDHNYGINNTYLQIEYRRLQGLTATQMKLDGNLFLFGIGMDI